MNRLTFSSLVYLACSALIAQETPSPPHVDPGIKALDEMGASYQRAVVNVTLSSFHGDEFKKMATLANYLRILDMGNVPFTDEGLRDVGILYNLTDLSLHRTRVTDDAFRHLARLSYLRTLNLYDTEVTGAGLSELVDCRLTKLNLGKTKFNQEGQKHLSLFPTLRDLYLG
jgi:hypothetical protein